MNIKLKIIFLFMIESINLKKNLYLKSLSKAYKTA